jgi:excisionase family DNA binding protein
MSNDISPGYYTIDGAASYLGVSKNTVRNMIGAGLLKAVRFTPRVVRISVADLDAAATPVVGGEQGLWTRLA